MKKIFLLFLVTGFLFPLMSYGHAPGYLGKKALVSLNYSVLPAFLGPTQNNRGRDAYEERSGKTGLNYEFNLGFDYVVGRYRSLGLQVGQYYTGAKIDNMETIPVGETNGSDDHDMLLRVNVKSVGLVLSRFKRKKGGLAPIGNRFYWGFKRNFVTSEIIDKKTRYRNNIGAVLGHQKLNVDQKVAFNYLLLGWSNDQIFWDKVYFKTGFHFAIPLKFSLYSEIGNADIGSSSFDYDNQYYYDINIFERLFRHEAIRFDIGVGYLLF